MHKANLLQRTGLLCKQKFKRRCSDLENAEAEVPKAQTSTVPTDKGKTSSTTSSAGLELRDEAVHQPIEVEDLEKDEGVGDSKIEVTDASSTMNTQTKTSIGTKHRLEALKARFIRSSAPRLISPPTEIEEASNFLSSLARIDLDEAMVPEMKKKIFKAIATLEADTNLQIGTSSNLASIKKFFEKIQALLKTVNEVETEMIDATNQKEKLQVNILTLSTEVAEFEKKMMIVQSQRNSIENELHDLEKKLEKAKIEAAELNKEAYRLEQDEMEKMSSLEKLKSELKAIEEGGEALLEKIEVAYKDYDEASDLFNSIRFP